MKMQPPRALLRLSVLALVFCYVATHQVAMQAVAKIMVPMVKKYIHDKVDKHMYTITKTYTVASSLNLTSLAADPGFEFKDKQHKTLVDIQAAVLTTSRDATEVSSIFNSTVHASPIHKANSKYARTFQVAKPQYVATLYAATEYSTKDWAMETLTYATTINQTYATVYNNTEARLLVVNKTYATDINHNNIEF